MTDEVVLHLEGLQKWFGDLHAVDDLSLTIQAGEFFTLLGPNGAGKTTTIKLMTGLLVPSAGTIQIAGHDLETEPEAAKRAMGYIPDRPFFYEKLTAREHLDLVADLYGISEEERQKRSEMLVSLFLLEKVVDEPIETFSQGMRQKLAFCGCFLPRPRIAVIDEPWVGLDPRSVRVLIQFLREECERGTTIFMSTHTLSLAQRLSDRTGILHRGRLIATGSVDEILEKKPGGDLEEAFLALTEGEAELGLEAVE